MSVHLSRGWRSLNGALAIVASVAIIVVGVAAAPSRSTGAVLPTAAAVSSDQAATSAMVLAADATGVDHGFYRGEDGAVYERTFRDGVWSAQSSVGGRIVGAPSATLTGTSLLVAARGTDGALWLRGGHDGTWGAWQSAGGLLSTAPAVASSPDGRIDVFARGADDALWTRSRPSGGSWSAWTSLGGRLTSAPVALSIGSGRLDVAASGGDNAVWGRTRTTTGWTAWRSLGGRTFVAPAVVANPQGGEPWVFVRGTNDALYVNAAGWRSLGGRLIDAPGAMGTGGRVDVVVRGADDALWSRLYRDGTWSSVWSKAWTPTAPAAPPPSLLGSDWTRIPTSARVVALTFDAGANADALPSIRSTLQRKNVPATFFLTGDFVRDFPAQANAVAVSGFVVGNHTDTHPYPGLTYLTTDAQVRSEVTNGQRAILLANGVESRPLFRFPYGDVNTRVLGMVNALGYVGVRWTVDTLGWQGTDGGTVQDVVNRVMAALQPGEIVLMHVGSNPEDRTMYDAAALPQIIDAIRARGYTFVTLDALTG